MKKIPLHSLVVLIGPAGGGKTTLSKRFADYEVLSCEEIRYELTGDYQQNDSGNIVNREINRRTQLKLELGQRVVVDSTNLRKKDRVSLTEIAFKTGVPIFYIICNLDEKTKLKNAPSSWRERASDAIVKQESLFKTNERDILRGDGVANVIDTRNEDFLVIPKLTNHELKENIQKLGFRGIMVIGDVHAMIEPLKAAIEWATHRNLFCVFLGDILDYGPNPIECVDHVYSTVVRGRGICLIGNHERKIERWIEQVKYNNVRLRLSEGNRVTTRAIEAMAFDVRKKFETRYRALLGLSRHHWIIGNTLFTHGAAEPEMFDIHSTRLFGRFETMALFGEVDDNAAPRSDGYPTRIYEWVNRIPNGKRVMVGHDIRSTIKPLVVSGKNGGEAYFMDTGSGKGGRLTSADILFEGDDLVIKNFKHH